MSACNTELFISAATTFHGHYNANISSKICKIELVGGESGGESGDFMIKLEFFLQHTAGFSNKSLPTAHTFQVLQLSMKRVVCQAMLHTRPVLALTLAEVHFLYWKLGGKQIN